MGPEYNHDCKSQHPILFDQNNECCKSSGMKLNERIAAAREHAKLSQEQLAKMAGISQQSIQKLESGKAKGSKKITEIAIACGVRPEWLVYGDLPMVSNYFKSKEISNINKNKLGESHDENDWGMDIREVRHKNFKYLISNLEKSGITRRQDQAEKLGGLFSPTYISQFLDGKHIVDNVAKKISESLGYDSNWMDRPQWYEDEQIFSQYIEATPQPGYVLFKLFEGAAGMGTGIRNQDYPEVMRTMEVAEWEVRKKLGFLPSPGRIQMITGRGPSMRPLIEDGDIVWIDTSIDYFNGDDYYLINYGDETQIKMLQRRIDGLYVVSVNPEFKEWRCEPNEIFIRGKALVHVGFRRF
ncbi:XRE family transcriptional regulator [Xylella fastidiosa]|uniref:XRE family transcriptional regulator n=1 Tax=Xylella fastidiosa TaxID=2371 RepID=UPI000FFF00A7|nr:XRE family transcriptional regulator [Xylella fastidiosa]